MRSKILILCLFMAACGQNTTLVPVVQGPPPVAIPTAQPLTMNPVQFNVYTADDLKSELAQLQKDNATLFALDANNYQNLGLNLVEVKRYLDEQAAIIKLLKALLVPVTNDPSKVTPPIKAENVSK